MQKKLWKLLNIKDRACFSWLSFCFEMVFTDNEFALGTIDIELAAPAASDTEEWIPFNPSEWQVSNRYDRQAKIVNKQCTSRRIRASCRYHTNGGHWLRLRLYVNVGPVARTTFSNTTQSLQFLELLTATDQRQSLFDNIAIARDSRTISPFGSKEVTRIDSSAYKRSQNK